MCTERVLFYLLLVFWLIGFILLCVQQPSNCKFFDLPPAGSGQVTPTNPHENPEADWFFNFTHVMTLTPYATMCCFLQLLLFTIWYMQLAYHEVLQRRIAREDQRGKRMREAGYIDCIKNICEVDEDDDENVDGDGNPVVDPDATELPPALATTGSAGRRALRRRNRGFRCVCGCCYCFSSSCFLTFLNTSILVSLVYLLFIGYGVLESTWRFNQNPECSRALPTAWYLYALNGALVLLYLILVVMRLICEAKQVVGEIRDKVGNGPIRARSRYAQIGSDGTGGDVELDLSEVGHQNGHRDDSLDADRMGMEDFLDAEDEMVEWDADDNTSDAKSNSKQAHQKQQQSRSNGSSRARAGPASVSMPSQPQQHIDDDTREMLDMLEAKDHALEDGSY